MELTPKEKAKELVDKFYNKLPQWVNKDDAKQCALIAVENEIIDIMWLNLLCTFNNPMKKHLNSKIEYLKQVKQEVNNL